MSRPARVRDALHDVLVADGRIPAPRRTFRLSDVEPGWDVVDNAQAWVGSVHAIEDDFIVVKRGFLTPMLYVPPRGIGAVQQDVVFLNVPLDWVGGMGWDRRPRSTHAAGSRHWPW